MAAIDVHILATDTRQSAVDDRLRNIAARLPRNQGFIIARNGRRLTVTVTGLTESLARDAAQRMATKLTSLGGLIAALGEPPEVPQTSAANPRPAVRPTQSNTSPAKPKAGPAIKAMLAYMRQHPQQSFTLVELAAALGVTRAAVHNTMLKLRGWELVAPAVGPGQSQAVGKRGPKPARFQLTSLGLEPGSEDHIAAAVLAQQLSDAKLR